MLKTFPSVAAPAHWLLGRSRFHGYVVARRGEMEEIARVTEEARVQVLQFTLPTEP